jgi:E3 ubiquitin-protein ligase BRE1
MTSVAAQHLEDLQKELEEYRELANNRLQELDKLHQQHREALKEVEKLKMDVSTPLLAHALFMNSPQTFFS